MDSAVLMQQLAESREELARRRERVNRAESEAALARQSAREAWEFSQILLRIDHSRAN